MRRKFVSILHICLAGFQLLYIYTPLHAWAYALTIVRWCTFPLLLLTGIVMMTGKKFHVMKKANQSLAAPRAL